MFIDSERSFVILLYNKLLGSTEFGHLDGDDRYRVQTFNVSFEVHKKTKTYG